MMSAKPALSVLICTRNRALKARRAVASVLANSFSDFELIVVDQSTDTATRDALATIDDDRLRHIATDTVGLAISRNIAIRAAVADIVVFTDDDCICDRDWLAAVHAEFASDPEALGVYGRRAVRQDGDAPWNCIGQADDQFCPALAQSTTRRIVDRPAIPHLVFGGKQHGIPQGCLPSGRAVPRDAGAGNAHRHRRDDTEFSYRLLFHRRRLIYSPRPVVEHDNGMPARSSPGT